LKRHFILVCLFSVTTVIYLVCCSGYEHVQHSSLAFYFHILTTMHGQNHFKSVTSNFVWGAGAATQQPPPPLHERVNADYHP